MFFDKPRIIKKASGPNIFGLSITFGDINPLFLSELSKFFSTEKAIQIVEGDLLKISADAIVSPGNSFGDMGGGIDKAIDDFFNGNAQECIKKEIDKFYFGELPVGAALIVKTDSPKIKNIIVSPTMRIPGQVSKTINAYLSMRAVLVSVLKYNEQATSQIRTILIPGLGTGVGGIPFNEAAKQIRTAYYNIIGGEWRKIKHPAMAPFVL